MKSVKLWKLAITLSHLCWFDFDNWLLTEKACDNCQLLPNFIAEKITSDARLWWAWLLKQKHVVSSGPSPDSELLKKTNITAVAEKLWQWTIPCQPWSFLFTPSFHLDIGLWSFEAISMFAFVTNSFSWFQVHIYHLNVTVWLQLLLRDEHLNEPIFTIQLIWIT